MSSSSRPLGRAAERTSFVSREDRLWSDPDVVAGYRSIFRGEAPPVPIPDRMRRSHGVRRRVPFGALTGAATALLVLGFVWFILVLRRWPRVDLTLDTVGASVEATLTSTLLAERIHSVTVWVVSVATTLILGGILFRVFIAPELPRSRPARGGRIEQTFRVAALVGIVGVLLTIPLRAVAVAGTGMEAAVHPSEIWFVLTSSFGAAAMLRASGFLVVLLAVGRPLDLPVRFQAVGPLTRRRLTYLLATVLFLSSYALVGHPQATEPRTLLIGAQMVHVLGASVWFGGLAFLTLELYRPRHQERAYEPAQLVDRFSTVAGICVALVAVSGLALARSQISSPGLLVSTGYGRALLIKLVLFVVVAAIGGYNHRRLVPVIAVRLRSLAWRRLRRNLADLRRTAIFELSLMALGVLLMTAAMVCGGI